MSRWDVFVWVLAPAAVLVAVTASMVSLRKGRRVGAAIGVVATILAAGVMVLSWGASSESFEDLALAATYVLVVLPATAVAGVVALWPRRPPP